MAARGEDRTYRSSIKKCIRGEARSRLLEDLVRKRLGLRSVEEFIIKERKTFQEVKGEKFVSKNRKYEEERNIVVKLMRRKLRENLKTCIRLRKERFKAEVALKKCYGERSRTCMMVMKDAKKNGDILRRELKEKNDKKIKWLSEKYEVKYVEYDELTEDERGKYGRAEVFNMRTKLNGDELRAPEVVCGENEVIELSEEESMVLALGPKFCVRKNKLCEEEFEVELEECIAKIKWDKMSEDIEEKKNEDADRAIMAILDEEQKDEVDEHFEMRNALMRTVYNAEEGTWNYGKKRVTDLKGNNDDILTRKTEKFPR